MNNFVCEYLTVEQSIGRDMYHGEVWVHHNVCKHPNRESDKCYTPQGRQCPDMINYRDLDGLVEIDSRDSVTQRLYEPNPSTVQVCRVNVDFPDDGVPQTTNRIAGRIFIVENTDNGLVTIRKYINKDDKARGFYKLKLIDCHIYDNRFKSLDEARSVLG